MGDGRVHHHGQVITNGPFQGVGEGQKGEENGIFYLRNGLQAGIGVAENIPVAEHDPLGPPRGP